MEKSYIIISGLEGSEPAHLTPLQQALVPYVSDIATFWAILWGITLFYVASRYVVIPFLRNNFWKK